MSADNMIPASRPEPYTLWHRSALARALVAALALALWVPAAAAQDAERQAPASIEADRAEIDRPAGVSRYFGNVVFEQGTLRITGERMIVHAPEGVLQHAEVDGDRAVIRQRTEGGRIVHARARHIDYRAAEDLAVLNEQAEVQRGQDRFTAAHIEYRLDSGRIDASGGDDGGRVRIRIEPQQDGGGSGGDAGGPEAAP